MKIALVAIGIVIILEMLLRAKPSRLPMSIPHFIGYRLGRKWGHPFLRAGYYLDRVLHQRVK